MLEGSGSVQVLQLSLSAANTFDQTTSIYIYVVFTEIGDVGTRVTRTLQLISCLCLLRP